MASLGAPTLRVPDGISSGTSDGNPHISQKGIGHRAMRPVAASPRLWGRFEFFADSVDRVRRPVSDPYCPLRAANHAMEVDLRRQAKESWRLAAKAVPQEFTARHRRRRASGREEKSTELRSSAGVAALKPEHHQCSDHDGQYQQSN
jgi:hypothetical protein